MALIGNLSRQNLAGSPLSDEQKKRAELMDRYWRYYEGNHRKFLKVRQNQPDDNVIINYSKKIVNHKSVRTYHRLNWA